MKLGKILDRKFLTLLVLSGMLGVTIFFSSFVSAEISEIYPFDSVQKKNQFEKMIHEMRCLVCLNQNLADSNAPLANDLRSVIYQRVKNGESADQIKNYLVSRYGNFISFKPVFSRVTFCLWVSPFILLVVILCIILVKFKKFDA
jgi:cytochrome c-type biogenesis protein CcmH